MRFAGHRPPCPPRGHGLRALTCALVLAGASALAQSAPSDGSAGTPPPAQEVLITKDGQEIALRKGYVTRGSRVVFTDAQGKLQSIRASEVDFEAMKRRSAPPATAAEPARRAPEEPKAPVLVLDSTNTAQYVGTPAQAPANAASSADANSPAAGDTPPPAEGEPGAPDAAAVSGDALSVVSWRDLGNEIDEEEGETRSIDLRGTVRNDGQRPVRDVQIRVRFQFADGSLIHEEVSAPADQVLRPGATSNFRVFLDDWFEYVHVEFEIQSVPAR